MMNEIQARIARELESFGTLFEIFEKANFQLYAVGGCVRDWALGKIPKDIDFTTDALPTETKQLLSDNGYPVIPVGEVFGTIATNIERRTYEITTFRVRESYTRGSRHPVVRYGRELSRDLERRDLTINAMAADKNGNIIDPFGGLDDLKTHLLRVPRSSYERSLEIFGDDPLRILRLARFRARLSFDVCEDAARAARDLAGSILTVSHERWFSELDGLLGAASPADGLQWLLDIGVLPLILPEIVLLLDKKLEPVSLSGAPAQTSEKTLWSQVLTRITDAHLRNDMRWCALFSLLGYAVTADGASAENVGRMLAHDIALRLKLSSARTGAILRRLTPLPEGEPTYRTARELAIALGNDIEEWNAFQDIRRDALPREFQIDEILRLALWRKELTPYMRDPASADIHLPKDLSAALMKTLGVSGKTLGLFIAHCRDAVLDQILPENAPTDDFVEFCRGRMEGKK